MNYEARESALRLLLSRRHTLQLRSKSVVFSTNGDDEKWRNSNLSLPVLINYISNQIMFFFLKRRILIIKGSKWWKMWHIRMFFLLFNLAYLSDPWMIIVLWRYSNIVLQRENLFAYSSNTNASFKLNRKRINQKINLNNKFIV